MCSFYFPCSVSPLMLHHCPQQPHHSIFLSAMFKGSKFLCHCQCLFSTVWSTGLLLHEIHYFTEVLVYTSVMTKHLEIIPSARESFPCLFINVYSSFYRLCYCLYLSEVLYIFWILTGRRMTC